MEIDERIVKVVSPSECIETTAGAAYLAVGCSRDSGSKRSVKDEKERIFPTAETDECKQMSFRNVTWL